MDGYTSEKEIGIIGTAIDIRKMPTVTMGLLKVR